MALVGEASRCDSRGSTREGAEGRPFCVYVTIGNSKQHSNTTICDRSVAEVNTTPSSRQLGEAASVGTMQQEKSLPLLEDAGATEVTNFATRPPACCAGGGGVPYRDLQKARMAFRTRDIDATRQAEGSQLWRGGLSHYPTPFNFA